MPIRRLSAAAPSTASGSAVSDAGSWPYDFDPPPPRVRRRAAAPCDVPVSPEPATDEPGEPALLEAAAGGPVNDEPAPAAPAKKKVQRGKATRRADGKWQAPEGNTQGFCCPPKEYQFKGKAGPGRPKNSRSQDSYGREALSKTVPIMVGGKRRKMQKRHLAYEIMLNNALEKKSDRALLTVLQIAERLFPEQASTARKASPLGDMAMDKMIVEQLLQMQSLGEPGADAADAFGLFGNERWSQRVSIAVDDGGGTEDDDGWSEGDWKAPGVPADDPADNTADGPRDERP